MLAGVVRSAVRTTGRAPRIILTYHEVGPGPDAVPAAVLEAQIRRALAAGYQFVPVADLARWAAGAPVALPGRALALTFDDGLASTARHALPVLQALGVAATVFPVVSFLGGPRRFASEAARAVLTADDGDPRTRGYDYMSWEDLDAWVAAGGEIGGHTLTHPFLGDVDATAAAAEVAGCRQALARRYGQPPAIFCYPFGDDSGHGPEQAQAAGFTAAVTSAPGIVACGGDVFRLPRLPAPASAGAVFDDLLFGVFRYRRVLRRALGGRP
jgi:peptidoglycan/xylan/chitin deacetylase (PgdA/CDA1 family)